MQPPAKVGTSALPVAEALRRAGRHARLSHESAARALGLELLETGRERLTIPRHRSRLALPGWVVVRADVTTDDAAQIGDVPVTAPVRTVVDLARALPETEAVVAADSALRLGVSSVEELRSRLLSCRGRGAAQVRAVGRLLDPASGSVFETLVRLLFVSAGLSPVTQYVVQDGPLFVARVDFAWPAARLAVEADGFAYHSDRAAYRRDRERLNQLERLGWRVLRFTWEDVHQRPEHVVALVTECLRQAAA